MDYHLRLQGFIAGFSLIPFIVTVVLIGLHFGGY